MEMASRLWTLDGHADLADLAVIAFRQEKEGCPIFDDRYEFVRRIEKALEARLVTWRQENAPTPHEDVVKIGPGVFFLVRPHTLEACRSGVDGLVVAPSFVYLWPSRAPFPESHPLDTWVEIFDGAHVADLPSPRQIGVKVAGLLRTFLPDDRQKVDLTAGRDESGRAFLVIHAGPATRCRITRWVVPEDELLHLGNDVVAENETVWVLVALWDEWERSL